MAASITVVTRLDGDGFRLIDRCKLAPANKLILGREGDVNIGVDPADPGISRQAVAVVREPMGWAVSATNRNGVVVHPWGQSSFPANVPQILPWSHVALRILGSGSQQHWALLEDPSLRIFQHVEQPGITKATPRPKSLTFVQEQTVRTMFRELLAWPPRIPATPLQLKQVAARLDTTNESIQRRLEQVRRKAALIGFSRIGSLSDPEYVYVLVRAGYLTITTEDIDPLLAH